MFIITLFIVIVVFFTFRNIFFTRSFSETSSMVINGKVINVFIADDEVSRRKGLSILDRIKDNEAMLFIFDDIDYHNFWMKDMKFSIDIIWLDDNKKVIYEKKYARPSDYPSIYEPDVKSLYVLEFRYNFIDENNIKIGDSLYFDFNKKYK